VYKRQLRLIPNLYMVRPADAFECAIAWAMALGRKDGPTAFALSRQKLPNIKRDASLDPRDALRGVYVAQEATGGRADVIIVATGSELHLAVGARTRLEGEGKKVRVVSAMCLETLEKQDAAYRERVLPKGVRKVSIEAGRKMCIRDRLFAESFTGRRVLGVALGLAAMWVLGGES